MSTVVIVDYGMGNLGSVARAVEECGATPVLTRDGRDLERATQIIIPGVGAFPDGMRNLKGGSLVETLTEQVLGKQVPVLGICLGMQLMATAGSEGGETPGLGWIEGEVRRLVPTDPRTRIPHVGWNEVIPGPEGISSLFRGLEGNHDFYFVHSYHLVCRREENVLARTPYCGEIVSAVQRDWIFGVQFHPEKSQKRGLQLLKNFLAI